MGLKKVAVRYAAAMFKVAQEANALPDATQDFGLIGRACADSRPLVEALGNPIVPASRKWAVTEKIFGPRISPLTLRFLKFAADKERLGILPELSEAFLNLERASRGVGEATVWTARPLAADVMERLKTGLEEKYHRRFLLSTIEDHGLLGGFKLLVGDRIFDYSVRHQLQSLETAFAGS